MATTALMLFTTATMSPFHACCSLKNGWCIMKDLSWNELSLCWNQGIRKTYCCSMMSVFMPMTHLVPGENFLMFLKLATNDTSGSMMANNLCGRKDVAGWSMYLISSVPRPDSWLFMTQVGTLLKMHERLFIQEQTEIHGGTQSNWITHHHLWGYSSRKTRPFCVWQLFSTCFPPIRHSESLWDEQIWQW